MTTSPIFSLARFGAVAAAVIAALAGCATAPAERPAERAPAASAPPAASRQASFAAGLRCMDTLLLDYGTRDVVVMVEDLADQTQRAKSGTKDILVAVVSDMTQRSRAVRLIASGKDWGNTVNHMSQAPRRETAAVVPQYALRGSLTQLDTTLSLDLTMLTTQDMSVVPGTATRNSVVLGKRGTGLDGRAEIRKFGVNHAFSTRPEDIVAESTRAVVELAAIELFGRLARVPYWTCLGVADSNEGVSAEIQDWYDTMAARPAEIIRYFQSQMRLRRAYDGPVDGAVNPQFRESVGAYREALGLSREAKLSLDFFRAYLGADHVQMQARVAAAQTASQAPVQATPQAAPANVPGQPSLQPATIATSPAAAGSTAAPVAAAIAPADRTERNTLGLRIAAANDARRFARGEPINLTIRPSRDAHVYCFLQDENRKIIRFFPNRFQRDSRVAQAAGLQLPGAGRFQIVMNNNGKPETVSCFATDRDVLAQLPTGINSGDFEPLGATSLDQVRSAFARIAGSGMAHEQFTLQAK